jgi:hypothetical protein
MGDPDYATLDLIAGDRARVFKLSAMKLLVESIGRESKEICPGKSRST